jgi:2'-5' RNA ligase
MTDGFTEDQAALAETVKGLSLPDRFRDRWGTATADRPSYTDALVWHLLLGSEGLRDTVGRAQSVLDRFGGFHMVPLRRLHITVQLAGPAREVTAGQQETMLARAREQLADTAPVRVSAERIFYAEEGIVLAVSPPAALAPVLDAARASIRAAGIPHVGGTDGSTVWLPHLTLAYSTSSQAAAPVIEALGTRLPRSEITVDRLSLVEQRGPETGWDWRLAGDAVLQGR